MICDEKMMICDDF